MDVDGKDGDLVIRITRSQAENMIKEHMNYQEFHTDSNELTNEMFQKISLYISDSLNKKFKSYTKREKKLRVIVNNSTE